MCQTILKYPTELAASRVAKILECRPELAAPFLAVMQEIFRAEKEHPTWGTDPAHAMGFLVEEVGEVAEAVNEFNESKGGEAHRMSFADESAQVAAVCMRILMHLDQFQAPEV